MEPQAESHFKMKPEATPLLSSTTTTRNENAAEATKNSIPHVADAHKKKLSVLPALVFVVISFSFYVIGVSYKIGVIESGRDAVLLLLAPLLLSAYALWFMHVGARQQRFARQGVLASAPMIWLPLVPVLIQMSVFSLRWNLVLRMIDSFPPTTFVAIQAVRALAVGALIKWYRGVFPTAFAWGTGFPDMLFGLSAVFLLLWQNHMNSLFLLVWNAIGFVIIVPFGVGIVQLGMPPTQLYESKVSNAVVFEYPMVLGPGIVVPTLLCWNALVVAWALSLQ